MILFSAKMGRYAYCIVLCCILIGAQCQEAATVEADNTVAKESGICRVCVCKDGKVNCKDQNLVDFFTLEEWGNLTDYKPTSVDLSDNLLTNITAIADLSNRSARLSNNKIDFIENASFRDLQEMRVLDLSHNKLTSKLSPHAFELNLAYNDFHSLHQDLFEHLPELTSLDLTGNPLTTIDHHLDLSDNQLTMVPQELEETKNLELHMCNMPELKRIGAGALAGLENLVKLHLSYNPKLEDIDAKALARPDDIGETYDWPMIKELYIISNNLSEIDRRLVSRWDLVEKLDVSNNPFLCDCSTQWMVDVLVPIMRGYTMKHLHDIHRTMRCVDKYGNRPERDGAILLGTLIALEPLSPAEVNLSGNRLTTLSEIAPLPIQNFTASSCGIEVIDHGAFKQLTESLNLTLSSCDLETIPEGLFRRLRKLQRLDLSLNRFTTISPYYLDRWTLLEQADFSGNPYWCTCETQWMVDVLVPLVRDLPGGSEDTAHMTCKGPEPVRGMLYSQLTSTNRSLPCFERMEEAPQTDSAIMFGMMIGVFVTFPMVILVVLLWKRGIFSKCRKKTTIDKEYEEDMF
ncbi:hypothetical protein MSG28_015398 [Choristoneura fumiferana]|uniref:Uncharacterized protein n=1 Tax=Choristoneura fumiferana TaxID=7141 RepID=A0ACC0KAX1_CHOFU|nr:hypothetical protein MSG28_015398 [Choristoneura fumiferana]